MKPDYVVKPFAARYGEDVLRIAADTAFFGEPVETFLEDRTLFLDITYRYYITLEIKSSWVAVVEDEVVGFLVGCLDTASQYRRWIVNIFPFVLKKFVQRRYQLGPLTWKYFRGLIMMKLTAKAPKVDLRQYPAHLHINLDSNWRGLGIGRRLIEAYLEQLSQQGITGVHLNTTDRNEAACRLYEKMGFKILEAHPTSLWSHLISQPVEQRCYGLLL